MLKEPTRWKELNEKKKSSSWLCADAIQTLSVYSDLLVELFSYAFQCCGFLI